MSIRPILHIPDPRLRAVAEPVAHVDDDLRATIRDMFDTMYDAPGIGLAGPQIGLMKRVVVVDVAKEDEEPAPFAMINPEILWVSEEIRVHEEGCLSIPEFYEEVERPDRCRVRYLNEQGETVEREADGVLSTCIQHEIDHLNGKLFIDYISRLKRERITKKFQKAARRASA
ncbi:MAG TPA: peptide deformylase [Devosiaceae bacterium]